MSHTHQCQVGDVVQLQPQDDFGNVTYGPLLCVVSEVKPWGVRCYAMIPEKRGEWPALSYFNANRGSYERIGPACWMQQGDLYNQVVSALSDKPDPDDPKDAA